MGLDGLQRIRRTRATAHNPEHDAMVRGQNPNMSSDRVPDNIEVVAYDSLLEKDRPYRASASALVISPMSSTQSAGGPMKSSQWKLGRADKAVEFRPNRADSRARHRLLPMHAAQHYPSGGQLRRLAMDH